jgi:hypothetical protein
MKIVALTAIAIALGSVAAHAQRYDSSYGYEMRGFYPPPSPFPHEWRERDSVAEGVQNAEILPQNKRSPIERARQQRERVLAPRRW